MIALLPDEVRERGGRVAGTWFAGLGRLHGAAAKGGARSRQIAEAFGPKRYG